MTNVVNLQTRKPYEIKARGEQRGEIYLYDTIGDSWEGTTSKQFAADLNDLGAIVVLDVYINSPGGSVFDGLAIYNVLVRHKATVNVYIDGIAASIASVVAMAGDRITIAENGMMMIHNPWGVSMGEADDFRRMADMLDKVKATIIDAYANRSGGDREEIERMMDAETWLTADEAIAAGLADEKTEPAEMAAMANLDLSNFKHVPKVLAEMTDEPAAPEEVLGEASPEGAAAPLEVVAEDPAETPESGADEWTPGEPHPLVALANARMKVREKAARA